MKIKVIIVLIAITLIILGIAISFNNSNEEKVQSVNSNFITNKVIVIDAGHGVPDLGAIRF